MIIIGFCLDTLWCFCSFKILLGNTTCKNVFMLAYYFPYMHTIIRISPFIRIGLSTNRSRKSLDIAIKSIRQKKFYNRFCLLNDEHNWGSNSICYICKCYICITLIYTSSSAWLNTSLLYFNILLHYSLLYHWKCSCHHKMFQLI